MKRMKMHVLNDVTFEQGCEEYLRDCEARNLRNGTIKHYRDSMYFVKIHYCIDQLSVFVYYEESRECF